MSGESKAVFLSYASEDSDAAQRIADALRSAGIEVWFDKTELRGGDTWDQAIRQRICDCRLFIPIISASTQARGEGYFRREWKLAVDRTEDMAGDMAFLLPVVIDGTPNAGARVPPKFRDVQWTRVPGGETTSTFTNRIAGLIAPRLSTSTRPGPALPDTSSRPPKRARSSVWTAVAVMALVIASLSGALLWRHFGAHSPANPIATTDKSIAVLPFIDMSESKDQGYFADGMAEEILELLAKMPQLTVIGRTSSFQFKGRNDDLRTIGKQLGVPYVVEGSVRRVDRRIRVTAQLIDARSGAHLWSESYDRDYGDVLTLQDEIATAVARSLQLTVSAHDARPLRGEHATEAYTLYLQGKLAFDNFSAGSLLEAQSAFQQALHLDPHSFPPQKDWR